MCNFHSFIWPEFLSTLLLVILRMVSCVLLLRQCCCHHYNCPLVQGEALSPIYHCDQIDTDMDLFLMKLLLIKSATSCHPQHPPCTPPAGSPSEGTCLSGSMSSHSKSSCILTQREWLRAWALPQPCRLCTVGSACLSLFPHLYHGDTSRTCLVGWL